LRRVTAVVLAGGASRRFRPDKLAEQLDGEPLLDGVLASLPERVETVIVVGAAREVIRPVIFTSEEPAGGGPAAALVAGLRRALEESGDAIVTLPGDAPLAGKAASILLSRLESEPSTEAVVGVDASGREQPLQLALRPAGSCGVEAGAPRLADEAAEFSGKERCLALCGRIVRSVAFTAAQMVSLDFLR